MSVKKNFRYSVAYQVLTLVLPLVTAPYLSRVLGLPAEILVGAAAFTALSTPYYLGTKNPYLKKLLRGVFQDVGPEFPLGTSRRLYGRA